MNQNGELQPLSAFAGICSYLLIGLFATFSLFCAVIGAEVYRSTVQNSADNAALRNAISYVTGKVRATDIQNAIEIAEGPEGAMLQLSETIDNVRYVTYIYGYQGSIRELFVAETTAFDPEAGETVAAAQYFLPAIDQSGLIRLEVGLNDESYLSHISFGSKQEG